MRRCSLGSWGAHRSWQCAGRGEGRWEHSQGLRLLHGKFGEYQLQAAQGGYNRQPVSLQLQVFCHFKCAFKLSPWQPCHGTAGSALG